MTDSVPIIRFGGFLPTNLREWDRVLSDINTVLRRVGGEVQLSGTTQLPTNESLVDSVRAFLPPPASPPPPIESQVDAMRAFMPRQASATPIESQIDAVKTFLPRPMPLPPPNDSQVMLAAKIFGAHR